MKLFKTIVPYLLNQKGVKASHKNVLGFLKYIIQSAGILPLAAAH